MTVNPEMLVLAREAKGVVQEEFAELLGVSQGTVSRWETGVLEPTSDVIDRYSEHLGLNSEFFQKAHRVYGFNSTVFFHRRRETGTDRALRKLHARLNILRMRIGVLLTSVHIESPFQFRHFDLAEYQGRVETIAQMVRASWRLVPGYVRSVTRAIEDAGGILFKMDFGTQRVDAVSEWIPGHPPIILINSNLAISASRLRLTLAHEAAHLMLHQSSDGLSVEEEANRFAGEFLMPRREIKASLYRLNLAKLADLKQEWGVSMAALVYHAHRLGTITPAQYRYLNINLRKRWGLNEPCEEHIPVEKPALIQELIDVHMKQLGYNSEEMARILWYGEPADFETDFNIVSRMRVV
jgi:Zn-dependent peptidase ImmA (M78 family)/transcriptional regulator with XRE-family HTH domain